MTSPTELPTQTSTAVLPVAGADDAATRDDNPPQESVWLAPPAPETSFETGPQHRADEAPTGLLPTIDPMTLVMTRLDEQLRWYIKAAARTRIWYRALKIVQLVLAAGVPLAVAIGWPGGVTGAFGAAVVVLEGVQQLFQFHSNWVRYSNARNGLERQKFLFLARAGEYGDDATRVQLLAWRTEDVVRSETNSWADAATRPPTAAG